MPYLLHPPTGPTRRLGYAPYTAPTTTSPHLLSDLRAWGWQIRHFASSDPYFVAQKAEALERDAGYAIGGVWVPPRASLERVWAREGRRRAKERAKEARKAEKAARKEGKAGRGEGDGGQGDGEREEGRGVMALPNTSTVSLGGSIIERLKHWRKKGESSEKEG